MIVRARGRILVAAALAGVLAVGGVGQPVEPVAAAGGYALELQRPGDFVRQTNLVQCVGASMQMMINIMAPRNDRTAATQHRLWKLARALGPPRRTTPRGKGASPVGWARGLDQLGYGPYLAVGFPTLASATKAAARAIRLTGQTRRRPRLGRPARVGDDRVPGDGRSADHEATSGSARCTVMDPLYPLKSTIWGQSRPPGTHLSLAQFGRSFVPRKPFAQRSALDGTFVLVLPVLPFTPRARTAAFPI